MKNNTSAIILIIILIIPIIGFWGYYSSYKNTILQTFERQDLASIDNQNLIILEFNREQTEMYLRWFSKRIFFYNNDLYKITKVRYAGEKIIYFCLRDHLLSKKQIELDSFLSFKTQSDTNNNFVFFAFNVFLKSIFFEDEQTRFVQKSSLIINISQSINNKLKSNYLEIPVPPPRLMC